MCCLGKWEWVLVRRWEKVAARVNEVGVGELRTEKAIRKKWTDMSSLIKKRNRQDGVRCK